LFICETGGQSKKTSLFYRKAGSENVFYIKGGLAEWESNSLPLSK
jgi:rhodanese-related sulfurtransferase